MQKVIISGITGQDGYYMSKYLLSLGEYKVLGGIRRTSQILDCHLKEQLLDKNFQLIPLDLGDPHSIISAIKNEKPDYFINLGALTFVPDSWTQPELTMRVNAISVIHILEAIRNFVPNCRFYSAGSSEMWGDVKYSPQDILHPMSPCSIYGVSKCTASLITKIYRESYNLYCIQGILTNHESEKRQEYFVTRKITKGVAQIKKAIDNKQAFESIKLGNINAVRDWSHAEDFMRGVWMMLNQEKYNLSLKDKYSDVRYGAARITYELSKDIKEYVLSSGCAHSIKEFVEESFMCIGVAGEWVGTGMDQKYIYNSMPLVEISSEFYRPVDVHNLNGDSSAVRAELGWRPEIPFKTLIRRMVENDINLLK